MNDNQPLKQSINLTDLKEDNLIVEIKENQDPVGKLINRIVLKGLQKEASEIHFKPRSNCLKVSFCQDGVLTESLNPLNKAISSTLIKRLKGLANLKNTSEKSYQEGSFIKNIQGNKINFWLDIFTTKYGEKAILRWWNINQINFDLDELIDDKDVLKLIRNMNNSSSGLLLVTGKKSSGKLTTMYGLIEAKRQRDLHIHTIENRLKYSLPNINQIELLNTDYLNYNSAIEFLFSQNVEVILIDSLRKPNTAIMAINAANKGNFVLSSLNTNDIYDGINKLLKIGVESSIIAQTLKGIINQRLLRQICPSCRIKYQPSEMQLNRFGFSTKHEITLYHAKNTEDNDCPNCKGTGYKGQIAVYEILPINEQLRDRISEKNIPDNLEEIINKNKFNDLLHYALRLVRAGKTTLAEIERVLPDSLENLTIQSSNPLKENENQGDNQQNDLNKSTIIDDSQIEEELNNTFEEKFNQLEEELTTNFAKQFTELKEELTNLYLPKITTLEKQVKLLTLDLKKIKKNIDLTSFSNPNKTEIIENLEELDTSEDWNDLSQEIAETLILKDTEKINKNKTNITLETEENLDLNEISVSSKEQLINSNSPKPQVNSQPKNTDITDVPDPW